MALFQKKPSVTDSAPLYSLGANKTVLVIGLGNPGKEYAKTRHNIGFEAIELFAKQNDFPGWISKKDLKCQLNIANIGSTRVILCKPETFMNNSGEAALAVQQFYKIANSQTIVVYDELAIPFGQIRTRVGGSDAGNNGIKSLINIVGEDFGRLRIGIGAQQSIKAEASDFVLGSFNKEERSSLPSVLNEASVIITEYVFGSSLPHETRTVET